VKFSLHPSRANCEQGQRSAERRETGPIINKMSEKRYATSKQRLVLFVSLAIASCWAAIGATAQTDPATLPPPAKTKVNFTRDIEPILRERCQTCHGPSRQMGGLRLDNRTDALKGGESGPVIRPGNSAESKLIQLVAGVKKDAVMPVGLKRLTAEEVGMFRAWIDQGAEWSEIDNAGPEDAKAKK
jgi:hypothetical protein